MARVRRVTVIGTIQVGRYDADKISAILLVIELTLNKAHALGESVAFITRVWWPLMQFISLNRVLDLVRIDAAGEDTDEPRDPMLVSTLDHIGVHRKVILEEANFVVHIGEQTSNFRSKMDDKCGPCPREHGINGAQLAQVSILLPRSKVEVHGRYECAKKSHETFFILSLPQLSKSLLAIQLLIL